MNVYDFDNTIYKGDSTLDFWLYCIGTHPIILIDIPKQIFAAIRYRFGLISKTKFKEVFFSFLKRVPNVDGEIERFWDRNQWKIKMWYIRQKKEDDLIISASPEFLLSDICKRMEIKNLIASDVDKHSGIFISDNCYGSEKANRFRKKFSDTPIDEFYSDSTSDEPLANLACRAFIVKSDAVTDWEGVSKR